MASNVPAFLLPAPEPRTELGRYRILSSTAGVRLSPLCLGAMSFGTVLSSIMGSVDEEKAFQLLDAYTEAGGNFIDTANNYQNEESETFIGNWMQFQNNRDLLFIATKFSSNYRSWELGSGKTVNYAGNHKKSLFLSVEASLKKPKTSYIDLLYVHWWDWTTSIEELMDSLHILIEQGKVLYLGASDTPAWIVSAANVYARAHGKTPFSVYQGRWNVMLRDFEQEIIPMARQFGMALVPWDVLGEGKLQTKKQIELRKAAGEGLRSMWGPDQTDTERKASEVLEKVAHDIGVDSIQQVALAYVMHKARNVFPLIGGRKVEHLQDNIGALRLHLSDKHIQAIESFQPFDVGFPSNVTGEDPKETGLTPITLSTSAQIAWQRAGKPIGKDN
ncbi:putative aryl-alcohol dehydrogenase AAD14 [Fusarium oxysporum f. sp. cubense]|uniref:Putative aryl-alcohol dehydrogenase AAD14 n=1 Tax=Fusarium oxysporum f. sp. cubense TaxID=61366 RepID=A0A559KZX2_FUSOC|nr:putative aryl-alcohol dehydrogenase AAD14 [Fusarium oxysporum f. sp. cubense]